MAALAAWSASPNRVWPSVTSPGRPLPARSRFSHETLQFLRHVRQPGRGFLQIRRGLIEIGESGLQLRHGLDGLVFEGLVIHQGADQALAFFQVADEFPQLRHGLGGIPVEGGIVHQLSHAPLAGVDLGDDVPDFGKDLFGITSRLRQGIGEGHQVGEDFLQILQAGGRLGQELGDIQGLHRSHQAFRGNRRFIEGTGGQVQALVAQQPHETDGGPGILPDPVAVSFSTPGR